MPRAPLIRDCRRASTDARPSLGRLASLAPRLGLDRRPLFGGVVMGELRVEAHAAPGTTIETAVREAYRVAAILEVGVLLTFTGQRMIITRYSNIADTIRRYYADMRAIDTPQQESPVAPPWSLEK